MCLFFHLPSSVRLSVRSLVVSKCPLYYVSSSSLSIFFKRFSSSFVSDRWSLIGRSVVHFLFQCLWLSAWSFFSLCSLSLSPSTSLKRLYSSRRQVLIARLLSAARLPIRAQPCDELGTGAAAEDGGSGGGGGGFSAAVAGAEKGFLDKEEKRKLWIVKEENGSSMECLLV